MTTAYQICYRFRFDDRQHFEYVVRFDPGTFLLLASDLGERPEWSRLDPYRCPNCRLDPAATTHCPVAVNLADIIFAFKDHLSYQNVHVVVTTPQRSFGKATTVQSALSSLVGLVMATSGCPILDQLRPMARFHLPFGSVEETEYRMVSMYLIAQYYRHLEGGVADWELEGLTRICAEVGAVNGAFAMRLREAANNDANINSLVYLDCFAKSTPYAVRQRMKEYRCCFESYLR